MLSDAICLEVGTAVAVSVSLKLGNDMVKN